MSFPETTRPLPAAFLDELCVRTPLPEMIGRHVRLERSGRQWKGNCPFHGGRLQPSRIVAER
jgi:DNA primase